MQRQRNHSKGSHRYTKRRNRVFHLKIKWMARVCIPQRMQKDPLYRIKRDLTANAVQMVAVKTHQIRLWRHFAKNEDEGCSSSRRRLPDHLLG
ncbi:hypothetical protein H5410_048823 [Solanum commersonii]|uniref:Uncharacterized protein n=1 Tax=Solanum commersonii TaxID=4109 RepID=A0A9J5XKP3_SOLCO|nr:hypothetical protein H5410_048823 [Solanum commersonii]